MRYLLALVCPPLALLMSGRTWQAALVLALDLAGLSLIGWGVGYLLIFVAVLWAMNTVSNDRASRITQQFIRTVKPIRTFSD